MKVTNWRTTAWGIVAGVTALGGIAVKWHATGQFPSMEEIMGAIGVIAAALGLKAAADAKNIS